MSLDGDALEQLRKRVRAGGAERYHAANAAKGKLFARERVALLVDEGSFVEDGMLPTSSPTGCRRTASSPVRPPSPAGRSA